MQVEAAVSTIGDAGVEAIELWGEVPHAYPDWSDRKLLKDVLSAYDFLVTMHAPFTDLNPASSFQPVKGAVERTLEDFVKFGSYLGASMITVHPGSVHNEGLVQQSSRNSIETLKKMVRAGGGSLTINVENQTKSRSKYHFPLASTTESLELILAEVDGLMVTLDTGHAHVNGQDSAALASRVGPKLLEVHLSDNAGSSDDHLIPGQGTANLDPFIAQLARANVFICLELDPHRYGRDEVMAAVSETKKKLDAAL